MKAKQLNLFIESDIECLCAKTNHALTQTEYDECLNKLIKIKDIIRNTGWDLSSLYYFYHDKVDALCNAWDVKNKKYLSMRSLFHSKYEEAQINVKRNKYY